MLCIRKGEFVSPGEDTKIKKPLLLISGTAYIKEWEKDVLNTPKIPVFPTLRVIVVITPATELKRGKSAVNRRE